MKSIVLKRENILAVTAFDEKNAAHTEARRGSDGNKRAFVSGEGDARSLIFFDADGGVMCRASDGSRGGLAARLKKELYLRL
ncbi:MAG: hypothetical protein LBP79_06470 [Clostridiales bacterium]|nr:hypothetical protein [Clostridiales bacterium]